METFKILEKLETTSRSCFNELSIKFINPQRFLKGGSKLFLILILNVLFITNSYILFSQISVNSFFVFVDNADAKPQKNGNFSNIPAINTLFAQYNVSKYEQAFPFANTARLRDVYNIECPATNVDILISSLEKSYPQYFSNFKKDELIENEIYNPVDYMWYCINSAGIDYLWHLKKIKADLAWNITRGSPSVKVAVIDTDFDITHPDLTTKIAPLFDPYDLQPFSCNVSSSHGTFVASFVAAETTETGNIANGQLASIGFNTMMIGYRSPGFTNNFLQKALHASTVMAAKVIVSCANGALRKGCPDDSGMEQLIVKEILDNGTTIVMGAGNGPGNQNANCPALGSVTSFFPFSPYYDNRIITVSSTDVNDNHTYWMYDNQGILQERTHSHFPYVDVCAPGYCTMGANPTSCGTNGWPYYGCSLGTSFSSPIVAGLVALLYSINPCMTPAIAKDILKNTTDQINDANIYPNGVGTGRINAYKAVKAAQEMYSPTLDLYIKDRPEDFGITPWGYDWQLPRDKSPDIWIRNQPDGFTNFEHQDPKYVSSSIPVYVYVRIRNKSCVPSLGTEKLSVYWSKAAGWSSWPQNWDGTNPTVGNKVDVSKTIPVIQPGGETIIQFEWYINDPVTDGKWFQCLLARIENSKPIIIHPNRLDDDVFFNNHVSWKNCFIVDHRPCGGLFYIGNPTAQTQTMNFTMIDPDRSNGRTLIDEADVFLKFDSVSWQNVSAIVRNCREVEIQSSGIVKVLTPNLSINNIQWAANTRIPVKIEILFKPTENPQKDKYDYEIREYLVDASGNKEGLGGVYFTVVNPNYDSEYFTATTNKYVSTNLGTPITLYAEPQNVPDIGYYWYDENHNLVGTGTSVNVNPNYTTHYWLEVSHFDKCLVARQRIDVDVLLNFLGNISPNPTTGTLVVEYNFDATISTGEIRVVNQSGTVIATHNLKQNSNEITIDVSRTPAGTYTIQLIGNGINYDSKTFVKL